jgi:hypothetical protein
MKLVLSIIVIFTIVIIILLINGGGSIQSILGHLVDDSHKNNSINNTQYNVSVNPSPTLDINATLSIPSNDYIINHINWSLYPDIQAGYISKSYLSEPNDVTNHKFVYVQICIEVKMKIIGL